MFDFAPQRPEPEIVTILRGARALVATPEQWCRGSAMQVAPSGAIAHCAANALAYVGGQKSLDANRLFMRAITAGFYDSIPAWNDFYDSIPAWNDEFGRTHADVLAAFDAAIALGLAEHAQTEAAHV